MKVKKLSGKVQDAQQIPTLFDNENITYHPINIVNFHCLFPVYGSHYFVLIFRT